nr:RNA-directed DNA polymerase, eukaryota, reverse transcriptase zinc-binding domain protein [Tanacetum cinerariifolium]
MSRHKAWEDTIIKLRSRLSKWKVNTLFAGGRLTLLKSVLGASPIYYMSIFKVPRAMYGDMIESHPTNISSIWCSILRELHVLKGKGFDFWSHCKKRIGNGSDMRFWLDCWTGDSPFYIRFPWLFAFELDKNISVANKMLSETNHSFRRPVRDGHERNQMNNLQVLLDMVSLSQSRDRCKLGRLLRNGRAGSIQYVSHPNLGVYWKAFFMLLGGLFGISGIVLFLRGSLQGVR